VNGSDCERETSTGDGETNEKPTGLTNVLGTAAVVRSAHDGELPVDGFDVVQVEYEKTVENSNLNRNVREKK
jgi:hypothetical protein